MSPNEGSLKSDDHEPKTIPKVRVRAATNDFPSTPSEAIRKQLSHIAITAPGTPLEDQLWERTVKNANGSTNSFWPPSIWQDLVTEQAIVGELIKLRNEFNPTTALAFAKKVTSAGSERGLTVFTILLLSDKLDSVVHMLQDCQYGGIRDEKLPLALRLNERGHAKLFHRNGHEVAKCCLYQWKPVHLETFNNFQRRLSPPIFGLKQEDNTLIDLNLDDQDILPWCEFKENLVSVPAMSGGFGTVNRVRIHPMCHRFDDTLKAVSNCT